MRHHLLSGLFLWISLEVSLALLSGAVAGGMGSAGVLSLGCEVGEGREFGRLELVDLLVDESEEEEKEEDDET